MTKLLVISGPSGVGKNSLIVELLKNTPSLHKTVSYTTRPPRKNEVDGEHHHYVSKEKFEEMKEQGLLAEYSEHFGHFYGTAKSEIEKILTSGDVLLEIDVNGAMRIKDQFPEAISIFVVPPSLEELESRLRKRGTEPEEAIQARLARASLEMRLKDRFNHVIINDVFETAVVNLTALVTSLGI